MNINLWPKPGDPPALVELWSGRSVWRWREVVDGVVLRFEEDHDFLCIYPNTDGRFAGLTSYVFHNRFLEPLSLVMGWQRLRRRAARKVARRVRQRDSNRPAPERLSS